MRKTLVIVGMFLVSGVILSRCERLKSPKAPVVVLLNAWRNKDYSEAFACLAPEFGKAETFEAFKGDVDRIRIKKYSISAITTCGDSAAAKGSIILEDGTRTGFVIRLTRQADYWVVSGYLFGPELLFED
jgi:hypothetical protein